MQTIALVPGSTDVHLNTRPEPQITAPDDVKVKIVQVGICGTDREETAGGRARAPEQQTELVLGHEMLGQVTEVGATVMRVKAGDYAVFTVRRGCGKCLPCLMNRSDMCKTGDYREHGIWGLDGFQAEYVVDKEAYVTRVPSEISAFGVLAEPLSVAEKALDEAIRIQTSRLPDAAAAPDWLFGRRCLVAGLGPIGLLGAMILRLRGAEVYGLDVVDEASARPQWLEYIGGQYIDGRKVQADQIDDTLGEMDIIFEATGVAALEFNLIDALGYNGIYVLTGIPGGDRPVEVAGASLMRQMVLLNQVLVGSVNAAQGHFQMAVDDLERAYAKWGDHVQKLITHRYPVTQFMEALTKHQPDEIKVVLDWTLPAA